MVNGLFTFDLCACDLGFERRQTRIELGNRQRVEILAGQ